MYKFTNKKDFLDFYVADDNMKLSRANDVTVSVKFSINGFSGRGEIYVLSSELEAFANTLLELELSRRGSAKLLTSKGDVFFEIKSIDMLGHIGIVCNVSEYGFLGEEYRKYESNAFLEIDPTQLEDFSKDDWIHIYKTSDVSNNN